jgi:small-conductance mechanosensitive channel
LTDLLALYHRVLAWTPPWVILCAFFAAIVLIGLALQAFLIRYLSARSESWHPTLRLAFLRTRLTGRFAIVVLAIALLLPAAPMSEARQELGHRILVALFIGLIGWIIADTANIWVDRYLSSLSSVRGDDLSARKATTQLRLLMRAVNVTLFLVTLGFALMSFDSVRRFGISLFASAGLAGVIAGLAAQPLLSNLIAGIQLGLTQPIRVGDVVVINNEWGQVEEFSSTYVVIRLWDLRRQIVPLSYFFQNVIVNWTRSGSQIIGSVLLYLDYSLPIGPVRAKATEIVKASPLWDGNVVNVQVSDATEQTLQLRVLATASDSSKAWDLRCEIREKLIDYIQQTFPQCLPRSRPLVEGISWPAGGAEDRNGHDAATSPSGKLQG